MLLSMGGVVCLLFGWGVDCWMTFLFVYEWERCYKCGVVGSFEDLNSFLLPLPYCCAVARIISRPISSSSSEFTHKK